MLYQIMDTCVFSAKSLIYDLTWRNSQTRNALKNDLLTYKFEMANIILMWIYPAYVLK